MRHVAVRRTALILGAVFFACASLFVWAAGRQSGPLDAPSSPDAPRGAGLFETYCSSCHSAESLRGAVTEARRPQLEVFLQDHGDASDAEDRLILDYLTAK